MTSEVHASCVAIQGRGVLIAGASGRGKSDLALRLIDRGATLVSDDYTILRIENGRLVGSPVPRIAGRIEIRGIGIVELPFLAETFIALHTDIDALPERFPDPSSVDLLGVSIPSVVLTALEASAPIKLEQALRLYGLPLA